MDVRVVGVSTNSAVFQEFATELLMREPVLHQKFDSGAWVGIVIECESKIIKVFLDGFFVPTLVDHASFIRDYGSRIKATKLKLKDSFRLEGHIRNLDRVCPNDDAD